MGLGEIVAIALAGLAAGAINTLVGSGTLITFPVLLAVGYRRELAGQRRRVVRLGAMSVLGGITGAVLLLVLPAAAFKAIVPAFIAVALVLTIVQPRLNRWLLRRELG